MGAPQYEQAGADVAGSGTAGTIPVWSSGTTLGNSIIIQGATGNAIGIGNTPTTDLAGYKALEVGGLGSGFLNADNDMWITANAKHSGGGWKYAVAASTPSNSIRANAGSIIFNRAVAGTASNGITWLESARIDASGNVGIGTASPVASAKLTLGGAANSSIRLSYQTAGTTEVAFDQMNSATGEFRHSSGVSVGWGGFHTFYTDTTEKVRISNTSMDASLVPSYGVKLPATPGNGDAQTFDAYNEVTLSSGFVTSGITSTGTIVITARITRYARGFGVHMKVAPSGGASLTFAAGWYVTLTGAPQMPEQGALSAYTTDGVGRVAVQIDGNATPSIAGMTTGNYGALGANVAVICSGFVT